MALIEIQFHSNVLDLNSSLYVIKPNEFSNNEDLKVLYLLHGYQGDYRNWIKHTSIMKYLEGTNLLVVMPSAYNSFYLDHDIIGPYSTYIVEEIYELINKTFNIDQTKENTFIAGLSMGGFGALKTALKYPDKYSKAVSFSGVIDLKNIIKRIKEPLKNRAELLFDDKTVLNNNLYTLSKDSLNKVKLYITCGTEDFLFNENEEFHNHLLKLKYDHVYLTGPGSHSWNYWDQEIEKALKWILD